MMSKKRILISAGIVAVIVWFIFGFFRSAKNIEALPISVTAAKVIQKDIILHARAIGNVQAFVTVSVKSRVDGQLITVAFKEGDMVKAGQIIFQLDPRPFQVALQQAQATLAHDQAQLDNFQKLLNRYAPLTSKGYVTKQDYDQADANVKAQAAVVLADEATIANAQLNLEYCTIRAPITGRTGTLLVNQGNLVKATDTNPLVVINQISPIDIVFSLPQRYLIAVQQELHKNPILPVVIQIKNPDVSYQAVLSFIDNTVDTTTGMIQMKALYANKNNELWPGLYVDIKLPVGEIKNALTIPTRAIQASPEGSFVFVVNKDGVVKKQSIQVVASLSDATVIKGLMSGMEVVLTGQAQLVEGSAVTIVKTGS